MSRFTGWTVIVTGAGGALGTSMVRRFATEGANVVIGARREEQVTHLVDELGREKVVFARLDVTEERQWAEAVRTAEDTFGPVSVLINNAARAIMGTIEEVTVDGFREVSNTNLVGVFLGFRAVAPSIRRAGGGSIVNINSTAGLGVAAGLAGDGIRVNGFHPGIIDTPLAYDSDGNLWQGVDEQAIPRLADVDEMSAYVPFLASDDAAYSTGTELVADGGFVLGPLA